MQRMIILACSSRNAAAATASSQVKCLCSAFLWSRAALTTSFGVRRPPPLSATAASASPIRWALAFLAARIVSGRSAKTYLIAVISCVLSCHALTIQTRTRLNADRLTFPSLQAAELFRRHLVVYRHRKRSLASSKRIPCAFFGFVAEVERAKKSAPFVPPFTEPGRHA